MVTFRPRNQGVRDSHWKRIEISASGEEGWHWITEKDAAEFAVEIVQRDDAAEGGLWKVCSGVRTLEQIVTTCEYVKGKRVEVEVKDAVAELMERALEVRKHGSRRSFWEYIGWFY